MECSNERVCLVFLVEICGIARHVNAIAQSRDQIYASFISLVRSKFGYGDGWADEQLLEVRLKLARNTQIIICQQYRPDDYWEIGAQDCRDIHRCMSECLKSYLGQKFKKRRIRFVRGQYLPR